MSNSDLLERRRQELLSLWQGDLLLPESVVEFAKNPSTAMHSYFEWDNTKAANAHRLWQARRLIVSVQIVPQKVGKPVQVAVSLKSDRVDGGGYRNRVSVMSNAGMRRELLEQALQEYRYWEQKYRDLQELADIFKAAKRVRKVVGRRSSAQKPKRRAVAASR